MKSNRYFLLEIRRVLGETVRIKALKNFSTKSCSARGLILFSLLALFICVQSAMADCSLTNIGIKPLPEMGLSNYFGFNGGLYPGSSNQRPTAHEAAGIAIAQSIQPLDGAGNVDTNTGKIVLLSLGMSNATQEWATKTTNHFTGLATRDPSLNPQVAIIDGAISGNDATKWTNIMSTNWSFVVTQQLASVGLTTNQVQVLWLKQALQHAPDYGAFPSHAKELRIYLGMILRNAKSVYPNLKLVYLAPRIRAYTDDPSVPNPEPFAFETGYAVKWLIEDQINGDPNLNWNITNGPVVAPWLSWGAYTWADGMVPRSDGLIWQCTDLESFDFMHPSSNAIPKVAIQLLSHFKTDPTTTPWFLKTNSFGPPFCSPSATITNGTPPLTVTFFANATPGAAPIHDVQWTFDDGESSTNTNPTKIFYTPGIYQVRCTVTDTNGNTAKGIVPVGVAYTYEAWATASFSTLELTSALISGPSADPDYDGIKNLLEYAMGCGPKTAEQQRWPVTSISNGVFSLSYPRLKVATDVTLALQSSIDLTNWANVQPTSIVNEGLFQMITARQPVSGGAPRFYRLRAFK